MATPSSSTKYRTKRVDRISELPDHLLCRILSFLPTRLAVATGLLSRRWEYVWTGVPVLYFTYEQHEIIRDYLSIEAKRQYQFLKYFINRVLLHSNALCLERVDFVVLPVMREKDRLKWFKVLSKRSIKEVNLVYDQCYCLPLMPLLDGPIREHLVALRLHTTGFYILNVTITSMLHLPRLEIVHLTGVRISDDGEPLSSLFRGSPCLKELVLSDCVGSAMNLHCSTLKTLKILSPDLTTASIGVPNLEYFELTLDEQFGGVDECQYLTDDVPCLVEAYFGNCGIETPMWANHFHKVRHTINLNVAFCRFRDENTAMHFKLPYFDRLKRLEVHCYDEDTILQTRMLLRHMPNCVSLIVNMYSRWTGSIERLNCCSERDSLGLGLNMEYIVINGIGRSNIESVELVRYLLVCCTGLKEMKLYLSKMLTSEQKNLFRKMIMRCPRPLSCKIMIQDPQDSSRYSVPRVRQYVWELGPRPL